VSLVVEVHVTGADRPAPGTPLIVELRDVTYLDEGSVTLARAVGRIEESAGEVVGTVELDRPTTGAQLSVWAHADSTGSGRVSPGDFVTTQSYPPPAEDGTPLGVVLTPVR
jgi:hypothetical protein